MLEHFRKDPVLFSYHVGDLDDFYFEQCQWGATYGLSPRIDDVILLYTGLETPTVLAFGLTDKFAALLEDFLPLFPPTFYCHYQPQWRPLLRRDYTENPLGTHQKMRLQEFSPAAHDDPQITRLDDSYEQQLRDLYETAYPGNYFHGRMLQTGKYFGWMEADRIVAVAGVHVDSDVYKIAVLGNIATHPDYRGKGLATRLTSRLVDELVGEDKLVCLNVKTTNTAAIRCYETLGFRKTHEYEEGLFRRAE